MGKKPKGWHAFDYLFLWNGYNRLGERDAKVAAEKAGRKKTKKRKK